ncbi:hypothetical protein MJI20_28625, partial [Salmonella enterica subsp. enterica serovar Anatum]|nr:hypothetical protein [Salmonella enterica subsp. enterica serovar Anatum]
NDDAAFERVVNTPTRGIGDRTLDVVRQTSRDRQLTLWQACRDEFAELITFFRADQRIEIAPVFHLLRGLLHFRHQRALALPIIC